MPKHWASIARDQTPQIHSKLLEFILNEEVALVRHSGARVIASIARIDLADGEWTELPGQLAQASTSSQVKHREVGVYILFSLLEIAGDTFEDKMPNLFALFQKTIVDPESAEVRINT